MKKVIIFFLLTNSLTFCKSDVNKYRSDKPIEVSLENIPVLENIPTLEANDKKTYIIKDTSLIKDIKYIPLETNENYVMDNITKVLYSNGKFYILDHRLKTIFIFDLNGKFIYRITKVGRGPGEYSGIYSFDIDEEQNIFLYDNVSNKILKYSKNGQEFEEFKLKERCEEFSVLNENELLVRNLYDKGIIGSHLSKYNYKTDKIVNLIGKDEYVDDFDIPRFSYSYMFKSKSIIYFNPRFTNTIYRIAKGELMKYIIIYGPFPTTEFIENLKKDNKLSFYQNKYITDIRDIFENSSTISISMDKRLPYTLLISKKTGKQVLSRGIIDENYFGNSIIYGIAENEFISKLEPRFYLNKKWFETVNKSTLDQETKNILNSINENSNPVLILIRFKEF